MILDFGIYPWEWRIKVKINKDTPTIEFAKAYLELAKTRWFLFFVLQICASATGIMAFILQWSAISIAFVTGLLTVACYVMRWRSDSYKWVGESIKRDAELEEGLGWKLGPHYKTDLIASLPNSVKVILENIKSDEPYYSSINPDPIKRLIENTEECSWWSKHLTKKMYTYMNVLCVIFICLILLSIFLTWEQIVIGKFTEIISKTIITALVFYITAGLFKLSIDYRVFSDESEKVELKAKLMLKSENLDMIEALTLLNTYQFSRARAPLIPDWIYNKNRYNLNELWKSYCSDVEIK